MPGAAAEEEAGPGHPPLLTLSEVHADIGRYKVLQGVDLDVPAGEVTMLLGRNGVGKTTTLRTVMGLWKLRQGRIGFAGQELGGLGPSAIARAGIGYVPEEMGIFGDLTVEENMRLGARTRHMRQDRLDWLTAAFPALATFWHRPAGTLSGGQKQMLSLARVMVEPRQLYLIDEPTKGLAPAIVSVLVGALRQLKSEGATILMVEQNFAVARALGDHAAVMDDGRTVWAGRMAELAGDAALQDRLMGLHLEARR
ncbi:ABC transporter ATP-binding protein [Mangrovicoccus sp. HB161399]|uniref:ABC transporter ATP-binding protein n=1 Tax=Mangrovicoccus sp. HB161399 TaxID=2720392 RepID=UPI001557B49D|nr:ABC transporter ATP-binding protein [Mangrovicoccus sp. HB161399]